MSNTEYLHFTSFNLLTPTFRLYKTASKEENTAQQKNHKYFLWCTYRKKILKYQQNYSLTFRLYTNATC